MLYLINKPSGISSHDVIYRMRKALGIKRIGHAGTLDPLASGLMIVATGTDTKLLEYVVGLDKRYTCTAQMGGTSSTYDSEGEIIPTENVTIPTAQDIKRVVQEFTGDIEQTPPQHSAVKIQGRKAYEYAREGQTVKIPSRMISIYSIEIENYQYPTLAIKTHVSSGTYIRTLIHDIGQRLNCGAYITKLERTSVGNCQLEEAIQLSELTPSSPSIAFDKIIPDFDTHQLSNDEYAKIKLGQSIDTVNKYKSKLVLGTYDSQIVTILRFEEAGARLKPHKNL